MESGTTATSPDRRNSISAGLGLTILGIALGVCAIVSTQIASRTILRVKSENQSIEISGFADRSIMSDFAIWDCGYAARGATLAQAHATLETSRAAVLAYLKAKGGKDEEMEISPTNIQTMYATDTEGRPTGEIKFFTLHQRIRISTTDVAMITGAARDSGELISQGVELAAQAPEYYYTKWGDLKLTMIGEAAADARRRAETLAQTSGAKVGALRYIRQGVFQIVPAYSTAVSDYGMNDTSSEEKTIKATVSVRYALN